MNLKMILLITLLVVLLMGMASFGYVVYTFYSDSGAAAATKNGSMLLKEHKVLFYIQLALHVAAFGTCALITYRG